MSLNNLTLNSGATVSSTGGTALNLVSKGNTLTDRLVINDAGDKLGDQEEIKFSVTDPRVQPNAPNGYTQARASIQMRLPYTPADGSRTVNTVLVQFAYDPHTPDSDVEEYANRIAQLMSSPDVIGFITDLSVG